MPKHLVLCIALLHGFYAFSQQCFIFPLGHVNFDHEVLKINQVKSLEVDYEYYMVNNEKGGRKRNPNLSSKKDKYQLNYLANDSGFVYGKCLGKEKDSMLLYSFQPLAWDSTKWIETADSMVIDSPFIRLYNRTFEDKQLRYTRKYNWEGQIVYSTNYYGNPAKRLSEIEYYYTGSRLDSSVTNPDGWNKTVTVYRYNYNDQIDQVLTYHTIMDDYAYEPLELYSVATYVYEKKLLKQVSIITPLPYTIHWAVVKMKWKFK